jgi:hypothetical protein
MRVSFFTSSDTKAPNSGLQTLESIGWEVLVQLGVSAQLMFTNEQRRRDIFEIKREIIWYISD